MLVIAMTGAGGSVNVAVVGVFVAAGRSRPALCITRAVAVLAALTPAASPNPQQQSATNAGAGYTIAHAGRQVRFGPVAFWIAVGTVVVMAGWSITTATYFAFRDDVCEGLIAQQAEQQFAYEDRIAELRAQIDRTTSRQLLDQEQFEQKLERPCCAGRRRWNRVRPRSSGIADPTTTGSIKQSNTDTGCESIADRRLDAAAAAARSRHLPRTVQCAGRSRHRQRRRYRHQARPPRSFARPCRTPPGRWR